MRNTFYNSINPDLYKLVEKGKQTMSIINDYNSLCEEMNFEHLKINK